VVRQFFRCWETDGFVTAFERHMHPDAIWQNAGFPDAVGREA
jgi:limonene-1,2-epoxide hydrolase